MILELVTNGTIEKIEFNHVNVFSEMGCFASGASAIFYHVGEEFPDAVFTESEIVFSVVTNDVLEKIKAISSNVSIGAHYRYDNKTIEIQCEFSAIVEPFDLEISDTSSLAITNTVVVKMDSNLSDTGRCTFQSASNACFSDVEIYGLHCKILPFQYLFVGSGSEENRGSLGIDTHTFSWAK